MLKHVDIYITHTIRGFVADGARYAYALTFRGRAKYGYGETRQRITRNSIILIAMKEALKRMLYACEVTIYMDSTYIASAFRNGWTETWKHNGYEKAGGGRIADSAMWEEVLGECARHVVDVVSGGRHGQTETLEDGISRGGIFGP